MKKKPLKKWQKCAENEREKLCQNAFYCRQAEGKRRREREREQRVESARGAALKRRRKVCNTLGFAVASWMLRKNARPFWSSHAPPIIYAYAVRSLAPMQPGKLLTCHRAHNLWMDRGGKVGGNEEGQLEHWYLMSCNCSTVCGLP